MFRGLTPTYLVYVAAIAAAVLPLASPNVAQACGGFFCNASTPVNQAAERIIFARDADGSVTAVIQVQYQGEAEDFAWMIPVAGSPEVGVSSNAAFQALQAATNPQYTLTTTVEGTCRDDIRRPTFGGGGIDAGAASFSDAGSGPPPVTVVDSGAVGPYDYVVVSVASGASDPAMTAVEWLQENGYDVNDFGADRLRPYLEGGMNLLAFRLTKGNDAGSIRPVMLGFGNGVPSIPIRPTAVAATDDMGVMVWVLGPSRAVPVNYRSLELNEALINWINPAANYNAVVTRAANEAGGQGFVTEMAGEAGPMASTIWNERSWDSLSTRAWEGREGELLSTAVSSFSFLDGLRDVLAETVPLPEGIDLDQLLGCVDCYYGYGVADIEGFDPAAFLASLEANVVEPMRATAELFSRSAYMTRLYTTMSADEMTVDPMFDFNPDLGAYSNIHRADRIIECAPSVMRAQAPYRVMLPSGDIVRGRGAAWPFDADSGDMPANARVLRIGETGTGDVVEDNGDAISRALWDHNATIPSPPPESSGLMCTTSGGRISPVGAAGLLTFAFLGLLVVARRHRS